ncbi:unnamed protein product [Litomosoides sigmodontis]|uniref:Uncharacterized protein n=1 Tax=Litomosoides sigmodontis TaxID=42156 RepID=A0A3P6SQ32_LITSI|nr:unnamed protein product [Litomosoides sigmodontis]
MTTTRYASTGISIGEVSEKESFLSAVFTVQPFVDIFTYFATYDTSLSIISNLSGWHEQHTRKSVSISTMSYSFIPMK